MSVKLIYRCGRFLDQGYVTLSSAPRDAEDERLIAAARRADVAGVVSYRWDVQSEGRTVTDELFYIHSGTLGEQSTRSLRACLKALADRALPEILTDAKSRALTPAAAREAVETCLRQEVGQLDAIAVSSRAAAPAKRASTRKRQRWYLPVIAIFGLVAILIAGYFSLVPSPQAPVAEVTGPTRDEVSRVAMSCYPDLDATSQDNAPLDELTVALAGEIWATPVVGLLDPLMRLEPGEHSHVSTMIETLRAEQICGHRKEMWEQAIRFRQSLNTLGIWATNARAALPETHRDLAVLELVDQITDSLTHNPLPALPADCGMGYCLPILHDQDIALIVRVNKIQDDITAQLSYLMSDNGDQAPLRKAEVILRGELSIAGADISDPQFPWQCATGPDCTIDLIQATLWLGGSLADDAGFAIENTVPEQSD